MQLRPRSFRNRRRSHVDVPSLVVFTVATCAYGCAGAPHENTPSGGAAAADGVATGTSGAGAGGSSAGSGSGRGGAGGATHAGGASGAAGSGGVAAGSAGNVGSGGTTSSGGTGGASVDAGSGSGGAGGFAGTTGAGGRAGTDAGPLSDGAGGTAGKAGSAGAAGAGTAGSTGMDASVPPTCTSMTYWTDGINGPLMRPGDACMSTCHDTTLTIAGTVYPTLHEPLDCNGKGGVQVVITPASGAAITLTTNAAGNFFSKAKVAMPFTAKVVVGGAVRPMMGAQTTGNCNGCHTQDGAMQAPGRIIVP